MWINQWPNSIKKVYVGYSQITVPFYWKLRLEIGGRNLLVFGMIDDRIVKRREEIRKWDMIDEAIGLEEYEIAQRNEEAVRLFYDIKCKDSLLHQKARNKWIKEGDANTSFFHNCINTRRKMNEIASIMANGEWREKATKYFKNHFSKQAGERPRVSCDFATKKISDVDNRLLIDKFLEEEIKGAIDDCDSSKSHGSGGYNFGFLKIF
ncbi:hypothetical protein ACS0TY_024672 [Phlomoides rotata]